MRLPLSGPFWLEPGPVFQSLTGARIPWLSGTRRSFQEMVPHFSRTSRHGDEALRAKLLTTCRAGYAKRARPGSRDSHQCQISQVRQCDTETVPQGGPLCGYIAIGACFRTRISAIAGFCAEFAGFRKGFRGSDGTQGPSEDRLAQAGIVERSD